MEEKADVGVIGIEGNHVCTFAISRKAASRVHPTGKVVWWGDVARHNNRVHSAAGKFGGSRKRAWGNRELSDAVLQLDGVLSVWQQVDGYGRTHVIISSSNSSERSYGQSRSGVFVSRSII